MERRGEKAVGDPGHVDDPGIVTFDGGLRLVGTPLWFDAPRPVSLSFISQALRFRPHQRVITSSLTAQLLADKLGASDALASPVGRRFSVGELVLELVDAGYTLGSTQLLVRHRHTSILYCGCLRLGSTGLWEPGQVRQADVLVLDCPYDAPPFNFPGRKRTVEELIDWTSATSNSGGAAVLVVTALGTAQEVGQELVARGLKVRAHRRVARWNRRLRACSAPLAAIPELRKPLEPGEVALVPRAALGSRGLKRLAPQARLCLVSGLAVLDDEVNRLGAERGFALSGHADAKALRSFVRKTGATHVYLGPQHSEHFERSLRRAGLSVTRFASRVAKRQIPLF